MKRQSHRQWYADTTRLKSELAASPADLELAKRYWAAISGTLGYDVRNGKRLVDTFHVAALRSDLGLAELLLAFRKLADEAGECPRPKLFDPALENLIRFVARQADHPLGEAALWMLPFLDETE